MRKSTSSTSWRWKPFACSRPDLMQRLTQLRTELTKTRGYSSGKDDEAQKAIDALLKDFPDDALLIRALFNRLFPSRCSMWRTAPTAQTGLAPGAPHIGWRTPTTSTSTSTESHTTPCRVQEYRRRLRRCSTTQKRSKRSLSQLDPDQLDTVLEGLTSYEAKFTAEMIVPAATTLLNLIDKIPEKKHAAMFDLSRPTSR